MEFEISNDIARVRLGESLCIQDVRALHEQILARKPASATWQFDLSAVQEFDSAGLQWLLMVRHWTRQQDIELQFVAIAEPMLSLLELYRVQEVFGAPSFHVHEEETGHA